jgi:hypothetical protein
MRVNTLIAAALAFAVLSACNAAGTSHALPLAANSLPDQSFAMEPFAGTSVLKTLTKKLVIGSTINPLNGDRKPYGLTIATSSYKKIKKGNLYICDFNNKSNVAGAGTSIVTLAPAPGSKPQQWVHSTALLGCSGLTGDDSNDLWSANYSAKSVTEFNYNAALTTTNKGGSFVRPFGIGWGTTGGEYPTAALWSSDASNGGIMLDESCSAGYCPAMPPVQIVKGFAVNNGKPGNILGPSGMAFDPNNCAVVQKGKPCAKGTLYVVDGANNTVVAINNALQLRSKDSIVVGATGKTFSGPDASWAKLIYAGSPLHGPVSVAVLYNGNIVVANTLDPKGKNLLIEISRTGQVLGTVNVDRGKGGAIVGLAATGTTLASTKLYFNDGNANNVQVLEP